MPCMGPSHDENKTKEIYNDLLVFLKQKHPKLLNLPIDDPSSPKLWGIFKESREAAYKKLYDAVDGLVTQDEMESF